ncbi:MAG: 50S ribosomal protein L11 methyltransferase [Deltaproteobacteria bacterium]|nr:50S ribosomal protein L11 methyltransferase [Deltaproteobacteria bacterium]MBW2069887.1 50S ribosomal protein L11 methyltransferase [Deltaproteobacteria bacterium]
MQDKTTPRLHPEQYLYIYELQGGSPSAALELEDLLGVWPEANYTYLFFGSPAEERIGSFLEAHPEYRLNGRYQMRYKQWQQLAVREPVQVDRFKIITSKQNVSLAPGEILLLIDPGVMFGSGLHPTTRGCLQALSRLYADENPSTVVDLGTGTGILAIGAVKLGATRVEAIDLNPLAVSTARANCRRNKVADRIVVRSGDARDNLPEAELLCVNIHFDFLQELLSRPELYRYQWAIMGGFLTAKLEEVLRSIPSRMTTICEPIVEQGWATLLLQNRQ